MENGRAQGTIEYIVIIAAVATISLVVAGMMPGILAPAQEAAQEPGQIDVSTQSIALKGGIAGMDGNGVLILKNNTGETISVVSITVNGQTNAVGVSMKAGSEKTFAVTGIMGCTTDPQRYAISVNYTSKYGLAKMQNLGAFLLDCEETAVAANPAQPDSADTAPPTVTLTSPAAGYSTAATEIDFKFMVDDARSAIRDCNLVLDYAINGAGTASPQRDTNITFTRTLGIGVHHWDINCSDIRSNTGTSGESREITILSPIVALSSPADGNIHNSPTAAFAFTLTNSSGVSDCNLYLDGNSRYATIAPPAEGANTFANVSLANAGYDANKKWDVNCNKNGTTYNSGTTRNILHPSIYLTSTSTNTYKNDENILTNFNPDYNAQKTYWYKWYKGNDLNATTLIDRNLLAYWPLNRDTNDYFGNYPGTAYGGAALTTGRVGRGYWFDGSDDYIQMGNVLNWTGPGKTIAAWIYIEDWTTDNKLIMSKASHSGVWNGYNFDTGAGRAVFTVGNGSSQGYMYSPAGAITTKRWLHIVAVWTDAGYITLYLNGAALAAADTSGLPYTKSISNANNLRIGRNPVNYPRNFYGAIDEVMMFNRALSATEISQLYYGGLYDGNKMDQSKTAVGETWKAGYQANSLGGNNWSADKNSQAATIIS